MRIQSTVGGAFALAAAILGSAPGRPAAAPRPRPSAVTFSREIRPILQAHCTICHSPGGPSPMTLVTFEDVLPWSPQVKEQALTREMPVWHAARGYGAFGNDPTLTPYELALVVNWADGGRDRGLPAPKASPVVPPPRSDADALETSMTVHVANRWITGWTFVPGDPLITSATFTSADGSTIGAWTAGDRAVRLPADFAIRVVSPVHVEIHRRERTAYETAFAPRASSVRFSSLSSVPAADSGPPRTPGRRVRIERVACGATIGPSDASLLGVRPLLGAGASALVTIERMGGAQPWLLGWFRRFDPNYPRIYWLERPLNFVGGARLTSDAPCELDLVLSSRR